MDVIRLIQNRHYVPSLEMLTRIVELCPDDLWDDKSQGPPLWQIVYHTLAGSWVWFRPVGSPFQEPPLGEEIAELKTVPAECLSKEEVLLFAEEVRERADSFFAAVGGKLTEPCWFINKVTNMDIVLCQVRHIQHHVGYLNRLMSEVGIPVPWQEATIE